MSNAADEKALTANPANNQGNDPNDPPTITVNSDGTWTPSSVTINPGGVVKFAFSFQGGPNTVCTIPFGTIVITNPAKVTENSSGTIKVGS